MTILRGAINPPPLPRDVDVPYTIEPAVDPAAPLPFVVVDQEGFILDAFETETEAESFIVAKTEGLPFDAIDPADRVACIDGETWHAPEPADPADRLDLQGFLEAQVRRYRELGHEAAGLVASAIADLLNEAIILHARDIDTFHDRRDALAVDWRDRAGWDD